jgi:hypothetical protein
LNLKERKRHIEEGLCFKCHKKGHRGIIPLRLLAR